MRLIIVRHGEAESAAGSDAKRRLTAGGRDDVKTVGKQLARSIPTVERIVASPYVRAQQTAELLAAELSYSAAVGTQTLLQPESDAAAALRWIVASENDSLLLVSHLPLVGRLLQLLIADDDLPVFMPACCAVVEAKVIAAGCADLASFVSPE